MNKETISGKTRFAYQKSRFASYDLPDPNVFPLDYVDIFEGTLEEDGTIRNQFSIRFCEPNYSIRTLWPSPFEDNKRPGTLYTAVDSDGSYKIKACFEGFNSQVTSSRKNLIVGPYLGYYIRVIGRKTGKSTW
jgi:hypothetical protein